MSPFYKRNKSSEICKLQMLTWARVDLCQRLPMPLYAHYAVSALVCLFRARRRKSLSIIGKPPYGANYPQHLKCIERGTNPLGHFHNKPGQLKSMTLWAMKYGFFLSIISSMIKAVLKHHLRLSTQHTSFIFEILIGYVAKNSAKLAYFFSHTCVTLHIVSKKI